MNLKFLTPVWIFTGKKNFNSNFNKQEVFLEKKCSKSWMFDILFCWTWKIASCVVFLVFFLSSCCFTKKAENKNFSINFVFFLIFLPSSPFLRTTVNESFFLFFCHKNMFFYNFSHNLFNLWCFVFIYFLVLFYVQDNKGFWCLFLFVCMEDLYEMTAKYILIVSRKKKEERERESERGREGKVKECYSIQ